jgi:hypothetical protein
LEKSSKNYIRCENEPSQAKPSLLNAVTMPIYPAVAKRYVVIVPFFERSEKLTIAIFHVVAAEVSQ